MITKGSRLLVETLSHAKDSSELERHHPPISLCLAGTAAVMNVIAAVLALMSLSVSS
ncbi:hypothetical protein [Microvirga vignae]|uniref:hypothetical protein n=1 Tax=Microvirga vignae TaxID=1225564 RepID=UPI000A4C3EEE|nr:hypothetical protein [Microvirga vignae]